MQNYGVCIWDTDVVWGSVGNLWEMWGVLCEGSGFRAGGFLVISGVGLGFDELRVFRAIFALICKIPTVSPLLVGTLGAFFIRLLPSMAFLTGDTVPSHHVFTMETDAMVGFSSACPSLLPPPLPLTDFSM